MKQYSIVYCILLQYIYNVYSNQFGPEPWQYEKAKIVEREDIPPDLRLTLNNGFKRALQESSNGVGDWFFKRVLAVMLKGGQIKENDDGVDISVQLRFSPGRWKTLNNYITSQTGLTEEMYRRSVGYIEDAIYKPTITDRIVMAWTDYVQYYLNIYKVEIMYTLSAAIIFIIIYILWRNISHKHLFIVIFVCIYIYEGFISYKEAEKKDYENFVSALNQCKWYFWSATCDVPAPDIISLLKHMHPLKIFVRIFTMIISEPMITISTSVNEIIQNITAELWFPLNKIMSGFLIVFFNIIVLMLLVMIVFNFILNIPFNLSFFAGLINIGVSQRQRTIIDPLESTISDINANGDRISGANLDRLLSIMATAQVIRDVSKRPTTNNNSLSLRRSASAGRLTEMSNRSHLFKVDNAKNKSYIDGGGDAMR